MIRSVGAVQWSLALFLSIILWVISIEEETFTVTMELPVSGPSLPSDFMVLEEGAGDDTVTVTFLGSGIEVLIDQITRSPESVRLNMSVGDQGREFPVTVSSEFSREDVIYGDGPFSQLTPESFSPAAVTHTVDRTMSRELPVAVRTSSSVPERYYWLISPAEEIEIRGAVSVLENLDSLVTERVDPDSGRIVAAIVKPEGVMYISPSSITLELVPPVKVVSQLQ